jgi:pimeloyl-ACP methyl ester carboxylesterase
MQSTDAMAKHPKKRGVIVWFKRLSIGSAILLLLLILTALALQALTTARTKRRYPPPGELVDVGGYNLHLQDTGSGTPTVVLEAGMGAGVLSWALVEPEVAKFARVISYDRAGLGWSDRGPANRTSKQMVQELNKLLNQAGIPGPYVLVGASFGGLNVRLFAHEYPDQVAGMVMVDPSNEVAEEKMPESMKQEMESFMPILKAVRILAPLGIARFLFPPNDKLPAELQAMDVALNLRTPHVQTSCDEMLCYENSKSQMRGCTLPGDIRLAVLSASEWTVAKLPPEDARAALDVWTKCQAEFANDSTNSFHLVVPNSGHEISNYQPATVVEAIRRVVESVRNQTKLTDPGS